jgi:periplasmic protein TonB
VDQSSLAIIAPVIAPVIAAIAACATPREQAPADPAPVAPAHRVTTPTPTRSDYIEAPIRPRWLNGTVSTTFAPGGPVIVAGDSRIEPDEDTRRAIGLAGVEEVTGELEVCSDADGVPFKVSVIKSTEYTSYDRTLDEGARRWRFIPQQARGQYVASCARVQLTYRPWRD